MRVRPTVKTAIIFAIDETVPTLVVDYFLHNGFGVSALKSKSFFELIGDVLIGFSAF